MKPDRLAEIVNCAAVLFDKNGYHQTSMEDIALEVGLKKPSLYHYVNSKDEILFLIHEEFVGLLFDSQRERAGQNLSYDDRLRMTMRDILRLMVSHRSHVRVFFEHYRELESNYRALITPRRDEYFEVITALIQEGVSEGRYRDIDPNLAAFALFGMCNWAYTWFNSDGRATADDVAENFWLWLTQGLYSPRVSGEVSGP
jgi:TetR/AcrR family transcriptional regulator, cholesterol catabolism regulator